MLNEKLDLYTSIKSLGIEDSFRNDEFRNSEIIPQNTVLEYDLIETR